MCLLIAMKTYMLLENPRLRSFLHQAISLALLLPALWLVTNSIINKHKHRLPSGILIEHAHPFKSTGNSPFQQHSHSKQEYFFFDHISAIQLLIVTALTLSIIISKYYTTETTVLSPLLVPVFKPANRQRPPPVF